MKGLSVFFCGVMVLAVQAAPSAATAAEKVERLSKEEVRAKIENPDWIIVDVRFPKTWKAGDLKIRGAVVEHAKKRRDWMDRYGKDKTLVFYCA